MAEATKPEKEPQKKDGKMPLKAVLIVLAVLLLELGPIGTIVYFKGGPTQVAAESTAPSAAVLAEQEVEALIVSGKFPNTRTGRTYVYDAEIYIVLRRKHQEAIEAMVQDMSAQISEDVREVVSRADRSTLNEPTLATIKRQVKNRLDERFGHDEQGQSMVEKVVIKKFTEYMI